MITCRAEICGSNDGSLICHYCPPSFETPANTLQPVTPSVTRDAVSTVWHCRTLRHWMTSYAAWSRGLHASAIDPLIHRTVHSRRWRTHPAAPTTCWVTGSNEHRIGRSQRRRRPNKGAAGDAIFPGDCVMAPVRLAADPSRFYRLSFHDTSYGKSLPSIRRARKRSNDSHVNRFSPPSRRTTRTRLHALYIDSDSDAVCEELFWVATTLCNTIRDCFRDCVR